MVCNRSCTHEITLDLGEVNTVSAVDIFHAEAGGESADMNTKSYTILVSQDGNSFEEVYSVTKKYKWHDAQCIYTKRRTVCETRSK